MKAIITADWHLRSSKPRCRLDENWMETQLNALKQVSAYSRKYRCPIIVVGDIFDTAAADVSFPLLTMAQQWACFCPNKIYLLAGNHDLQYHDVNNLSKSGIGVLLNSANIAPAQELESVYAFEQLGAYNFEEEKTNHDDAIAKQILFIHTLVFPNMKDTPPNAMGITAKELFERYPTAQYIFTGDNHRQFHIKQGNRHIINPGCLIRQSANEKDYKTAVYFVDTDSDEIISLPITDTEELVTDEYLREAEDREGRINAFVELLKTKGGVTLDFVKNVETAIKENRLTDQTVLNCIRELLGEN